jgi:hypothetical protein
LAPPFLKVEYIMVKGKCCICGTVKNCGPYLVKVLQNIDKIGALFDEYVTIFAYDNSSDNSLEILENYKNTKTNTNTNTKIIIDVNKDQVSEFRVYNIAKARNKCLNIIRQNFVSYDYFIMIDCDDVSMNDVNLEPLKYYLEKGIDDWDGLSFNKKVYYDLWALSKFPYSYSCWHFKDWKAWGRYIEKIIWNTPPKTLIQCFSAFNGFSIYKTNKFINCFYDPTLRLDLLPKHLLEANERVAGPMKTDERSMLVDCEHRSFHLMAITQNGAKIRIAPEIIF